MCTSCSAGRSARLSRILPVHSVFEYVQCTPVGGQRGAEWVGVTGPRCGGTVQ